VLLSERHFVFAGTGEKALAPVAASPSMSGALQYVGRPDVDLELVGPTIAKRAGFRWCPLN
jgi:hypothetical protein